MLTKRQKQVLDFIRAFTDKKGYSPSLEEIAKHLRLSSVSTAHFHVSKLKKLGYLKKQGNRPRAMGVYDTEPLIKIPLLGIIAAGQPIEAIENRGTVNVPKSQLSKSGEHFALKVSGDSMINEGISDGDIVVIRKQPTAENGETIVALLNDNEVTLKKIFREKNGFRLQPANPSLKPIFTKELAVQGKVITVIRKFEELKEKIVLEKEHTTKEKDNSENIFKKWLNTIQCMDCLEGLKQLPNESIDLIIADPPYGLDKDFGNDSDKIKGEKYIEFTKEWTDIAIEKLKPNGSFYIFLTWQYSPEVFSLLKKKLLMVNEIIWDRKVPSMGGSTRKYSSVHDTIGFFVKGKKYYFDLDSIRIPYDPETKKARTRSIFVGKPWLEKGYNPKDVWPNCRIHRQDPERENHPTQKPLEIIDRMIKASCPKNGVVLDPFMGSGTTAVSCILNNRDFIGFEINPKYHQMSLKRLERYSNNLFNIKKKDI